MFGLSHNGVAAIRQGSSTFAAVCFVYAAFSSMPVVFLLLGAFIDLSTAHTVMTGVNKDRYKQLEKARLFYNTHGGAGYVAYGALLAYIISLFIYPTSFLYWIFLSFWGVTYVTGTWAFIRLLQE